MTDDLYCQCPPPNSRAPDQLGGATPPLKECVTLVCSVERKNGSIHIPDLLAQCKRRAVLWPCTKTTI